MDEIIIDLSKEKFTEMIAREKEFIKYANLLAENDMFESVVDFFYSMPTALDVLLESNAMNQCMEDDYYDYISDDTVSAEYIANIYYPYFNFVDKKSRMTKEAMGVQRELIETAIGE